MVLCSSFVQQCWTLNKQLLVLENILPVHQKILPGNKLIDPKRVEQEMLNLTKSRDKLNDFQVTGDNTIQMYNYYQGLYEIQ